MSTVGGRRLRVAFAGAFAVHLAERVRTHLGMPCDIIQADDDYGRIGQCLARRVQAFDMNGLMTPHVSGWTEGMLEARARLIAENTHRAARGEPPLHLISPSAA